MGTGTTIDFVEVSHSGDDGFEFFGGTVNCKHLVSYSNKDDDFDFDLGYQGNVQFALAVRNPDLSDVSGSNGIEVDNDNAGTPVTPKTRPTLSNITIVGPTGTMDDNFRRAAYLRRNSEPALYNSLFIGSFPIGLCLDGVGTIANAQNNLLEVKNTFFADAPELLKSSEPTFNITQWFDHQGWENAAMINSQPLSLQSPFNVPDPNAQPLPGSTVNNSASFDASRANVSFFEKITYVGAFNHIEDWSCGWAKFEILNTNCTVDNEEPALLAAHEIVLTPTVATQQIVLSGNLDQSTDFSVGVYALNGQFLGDLGKKTLVSGNFSETYSVEHLSAGAYVLQIRVGNGIVAKKLIIGN